MKLFWDTVLWVGSPVWHLKASLSGYSGAMLWHIVIFHKEYKISNTCTKHNSSAKPYIACHENQHQQEWNQHMEHVQDGLVQVHSCTPLFKTSATRLLVRGHRWKMRYWVQSRHVAFMMIRSCGSERTLAKSTTLQSFSRFNPFSIKLKTLVKNGNQENNKTGDHHGYSGVRVPESE